jgi:hypothetical protein
MVRRTGTATTTLCRCDRGPRSRGASNGADGDQVGSDARPITTAHRPPPIARDAATAAGWGDRPPPTLRTIALVAWQPLTKGALRGFASVELPIGLRLIDCPVYVGKNGPFAALPSKPRIDKEGPKRTDPNGKPAYAPVLEWRSRALRDRFSEVVTAAIRRMYPGALNGGGQ